MFDLEMEAAARKGGGKISLPLVQISLSPQPYPAIKIKDGEMFHIWLDIFQCI